eukprot:gene22908-62504_t
MAAVPYVMPCACCGGGATAAAAALAADTLPPVPPDGRAWRPRYATPQHSVGTF